MWPLFLQKTRLVSSLVSLRLNSRGQGQKLQDHLRFRLQNLYTISAIFSWLKQVTRLAKIQRVGKNKTVFLDGRRGKNQTGLYREIGGVIMIIFANNLLHALFCIFHPFVSSCFGLNFLLSYLPVTNSLFNCI